MRDFTSDHSALALNTATLGHLLDGYGAGWSPEQIIDGCAQRGVGGVVFWRREIGARAQAIGDYARAAGVAVIGLCRAPFLVGPLALPSKEAVMDDVRAAIDMAAALGAPILTIVVGGVQPGSNLVDSLELVAERTAEAAPYARTRGVSLALEPLHPVYGGDRSCLVTVRDGVDLIHRIGAPNVGLAIDVYHVWWDTSLDRELRRLAPDQILGFHLCDWLAETTDVLLDRGMMGDGVADLRALRSAVEGAGYRSWCEVEIFSRANWWRRPPGEVLDAMVERFRTHC